ncbi:transcription repressor OFP6-like [Chenopodium quinoa]|uniref:transcription repressor OFP6-like n=1 Tax=Chenopodium quinoa TaxID=63459 RepID=UPI000B78680F|nr:transcription repressor OFP6-like [Chenopodium quinoa]
MSSNKRKVLLNTVSVNLGCYCRKPKLSSIFSPKPKSKTPKYQKYQNYSYSSSTSSTNTTWDKTTRNFSSSSPYECYYPTINSTTFSPYVDTTTSSSSSSQPSSSVDGFGRVGTKSMAVEKDSTDPYLDFRQSMLQMIMENQIYTKNDLKELLNCFLQLNSPSLHGTIIRVFTEIWNSFFFNGRPDHSSPRFFIRPSSYEI